MERKFFSPKEIEAIYGIPENTLARWRHLRQGPSFFKLGGKVMYKREQLDTWIEEHRFDCD
jgi:hypothetical protein